MFLNDVEIKYRCEKENMITPFIDRQIKEENNNKIISYGLSSRGYDVRISNKFKILDKNRKHMVIDPKNIHPQLFQDIKADSLIINPNSFILGHTIEKFKIPRDIIAICVGKSTLARLGLIVNITPIEPEWSGHITIELSNTSTNPIKIYAYEGIAQFLFEKGSPCNISYNDRNGKYQNQNNEVILARI